KLAGKTALVTGAGRGIGRAIAKRLAADGAHVAVNYARSAEAAASLVDEIKKEGGDAFTIQADVSELDQIETMINNVASKFSSLDFLINNAGRGSRGLSTLDGMTPENFDQIFSLNARGLFFTTQAAARI